MISYPLIVVFATAFVLAVFWFVAKTIGKLSFVKNSPSLDDGLELINPKLAEQRTRARAECSLRAETLSEAVRALADSGDKLGATQAYRSESGLSLTEAKETVEVYMRKRG